jgi:tRNA(Ile)-lysidine synthase
MGLLEKVASTVRKHRMLSGDESVVVGLSGGPDSVCLLVALRRLYPGLRIHAVYVDHGLRPRETPGEARFCRDFCLEMEVPFSVKKVDVRAFAREHGLNTQEAARELRYAALGEACAETGSGIIALGHNLDDQAETFLMRVLRGTGRRGLGGIPPVRGNVIRPLIETGRAEIESFLRAEGIGHVVDSSNLKGDYLRNRIRSRLMPVLRDLNPDFAETLSHTAEIFREEERYLEAAVTKSLMKLISRKSKASIELFSAPLESMDRSILRRVLRRAIGETEGLRGIGFRHIEDVIGLAAGGKAGDRVYLPRGIRAIKKYSTLLITSEPPARLGSHALEKEGTLAISEAGLAIVAAVTDKAAPAGGHRAVLDAGKAGFPLTVRARRHGDFFYPAGFGKRKKLQDYFVDEKVPRDERDAVPVVASGGEIVWVAGMRADERFVPSEKTKRFLVLELKRADPR